MLQFSNSAIKAPRINKTQAKKLEKLNILTIEDLLYHFPSRYDDFSFHKKIDEIGIDEMVTIKGKVIDIKTSTSWKKRMKITEVYIEDETGNIKATWFHFFKPLMYLRKGKYVQFSGKTSIDKKGELHLQHPNFEIIPKSQIKTEEDQVIVLDDEKSKNTNTGTLVPIYPETKGITSFWLRSTIQKTLENCEISEFIPGDILKSQKLENLENSLWNIHFPKKLEESEIAKKRFAFEKMFLLQLKNLQDKKNRDSLAAPEIPFEERFVKNFVKSLPFVLTDAQKKVAWQIIKDLGKNVPMNRLLEGDVGSGKTVVAVIAIISVANGGRQSALLAPTEVLAIQHYEGISKFLSNFNFCQAKKNKKNKCLSFNHAILTASQSKFNGEKISKPKLKKLIEDGEVDFVVGTHAILQKTVKFKNLGLVIIDEQHRFGVNQRAYLQQITQKENGKLTPHLLTMTATPIPRTLSLAVFGNLDLSIIDVMPSGRKKIITKVVNPASREQVYEFVRKEVKGGRQVFVICPLVEESSKITEVKAVTEEQKKLQEKIFPDLKVALLHGKMKPKEKDETMKDFKNKKFDIVVSTSVVEVGVDVPNATIMLIEGAERFGLSQLHQFRGRVGRGEFQSYCFLFTSNNVANSTARLKAMEKTNDGFKIAEEDMKLRGPGQFMGTLQSGVPDIAMESLTDVKTIQKTKMEAERVFVFDPSLKKFPLLKEKIEKLTKDVHWE